MQTDKEKTREYSQINHITLLILEQNIPGSCGTQNILSLNVYMQTHVQTQQYTGFFFFFLHFSPSCLSGNLKRHGKASGQKD